MSAPTVNPEHAIIRPSTSDDIIYRAFSRPYIDGPGQVLNLFASCSYVTGQWQIFFTGNGDGTYTLMEKVPGIANQMVTYYVADFTTGAGLIDHVSSVIIKDANGSHTVKVEPLK